MKTIQTILITSFALFIFACSGNEKTEDVGVGANAAVESLEALSKEDSLACSCEHKCKTKEECKAHCGDGCASLN
jgi:hypothetical protein